jgi:hypothetical protein
MTQTLAETALDGFLDTICHGSPADHGDGLHDGAALFGFEDGLFVRADRQTYLNFARKMRPHQPPRREVAWRQVHGRVASACIIERDGATRRVSVITMMHFETGWKTMTHTFEAGEEGLR